MPLVILLLWCRVAWLVSEAMIADLGARGVWRPQAMALFDIYVVDTDAKLYLLYFPISVLA